MERTVMGISRDITTRHLAGLGDAPLVEGAKALWNSKEFRERYGIGSEMTRWRWTALGLPGPDVRICNHNFWTERRIKEADAWIVERRTGQERVP